MNKLLFLHKDDDFSRRVVPVMEKEFEVYNAESLIEGFNLFRKNTESIDLLLLSCNMPVQNTIDIAEAEGGLLSGPVFAREIYEEILGKNDFPPVIFIKSLPNSYDEKIKKIMPVNRFFIIKEQKIDLGFNGFNDLIRRAFNLLNTEMTASA